MILFAITTFENVNQRTYKSWKLFKKKEIYFVTFEFLNPKYAELFKEANKHVLLETVINKLTKEL